MSKPSSPARNHDHDREDEDDAANAERELDGRNTSFVRGTPSDRDRSSRSPHVHSRAPRGEGQQQHLPSLPPIDSFTAPSAPSAQPHSHSPFHGNGHSHGHRSSPPTPQSPRYTPSSPPSVPSGMRGLINPYSTHVNHSRRPSSPTEYGRSERESRRRRGSPPPTYNNNRSGGHS